MKRNDEEQRLQNEIELAIGAEPDLLLLRNAVGHAKFFDDDGNKRIVSYGLLKGSPDLVGILAPHGRWFCLELKAEDGRLSPDQKRVIPVWRSFGAFVGVVRTVEEAKAALARAKRGEFE